jgi:hypothetical protein
VTRDVDAAFKPHGIVLEEARKVADDLGLPFKPWAVREIKDFSERTVLLASGQPVSESAAVPVMPSGLTVCCGGGRSMLSV